MNNLPTVYLISGPLGAGKTSVTRNLAGRLKNSVLIEGDVLFHALENNSLLSWEERLEVTWKNIIAITGNYLAKKLDVIIDFVVEDELEQFSRSFHRSDANFKYIVLITDEDTLKQRLANRNELRYLDRSLILLKSIGSDPGNADHFLDTTRKNIPELARTIISDERFSHNFTG